MHISHKFEIKEGAFFIADAHESENKRRNFGKFIDAIYEEKLKPTQLFLMGDIYDILIGNSSYSKDLWQEHLKKLDEIAKKIEVYYFEGNHDFNLSKIFLHVKVFPLKLQPQTFYFKDKVFALSHGDTFGTFGYKIYTKIIRSRLTLFCLKIFESLSGYLITKNMTKKLENKKLCNEIKNFKNIIDKKIVNYKNYDFIFEGHYHQDKTFVYNDVIYINFGSFACKNNYYIFTCKNKRTFIEKIFNP